MLHSLKKQCNLKNFLSICLKLWNRFQYTAYFEDNDERENTAYVDDNGNKVKIGYPLPEALWRTNHGYDPIIRQNFEWSQSPNSSTIK